MSAPERPWPDRNVPDGDQLLLTESTVGQYLVSRGLLPDAAASVTRLAGGVSNITLAVKREERAYLVKQSLARLAVADEWFAPTDRIITEAEAMVKLASITPDSIPVLFDQDAARHTIVLQLAPADWTDWKGRLMAGDIDQAVAGALGGILASWHRETFSANDFGPRFDSYDAFELLRIDPYYRTVARRVPRVASCIDEILGLMAMRRTCLVHGDFSPKNILVPSSDRGTFTSPWVIDFEVAHRGDPAFDVAFMCTHLLLKSLAMPESGPALDACLRKFAMCYRANVTAHENCDYEAANRQSVDLTPLQPDWTYIGRHIGALLLARVKGKSPVEYLTEDTKRTALSLGIQLLETPASSIDGILERRDSIR